MTETDYSLVAVRALETAGFKVRLVRSDVTYRPMEDPEFKKAIRSESAYDISILAHPAEA
jgi:hypothetical protein